MFGRRKRSNSSESSKNTAPDYRVYRLKAAEILKISGAAVIGTAFLSWLFYNSFVPALVGILPITAGLLFVYRKHLQRLRLRRMRQDFLQAVRVFGEGLRAGYSARNALLASSSELQTLLPEKSEVLSEWQRMSRMIQNGEASERAFSDFAERSGVAEIRTFSGMLSAVLQSGGSLSEIVDATARDLEEQESVLSEIRTKLSSKILEQRIMDVVPAAVLLYVRVGSPGLLRPMYEGLFGRSVMTGCLGLYFAAVLLSEHILRAGHREEQ